MIPPGSTIGILGGGQLGRMSSVAASRMGYHVHIYEPGSNSPASEVSRRATHASYDDISALKDFAKSVDVVTIEFENIPWQTAERLAEWVPVHPAPSILRMAQHRIREKEGINALGVATAPFAPLRNEEDIPAIGEKIGYPAIMKTAEAGYDGKGQAKVHNAEELTAAWQDVGKVEAIVEGLISFERELSILVARNQNGEVSTFPLVENIHRNHILYKTIAPAPQSGQLSAKAESIARTIAEGINLIGILAIELFATQDGELLVNELAPRPHNSGHWTIEACLTSQFEQHIRAVCNLPLGSTESLCPAEMINLIGTDVENWQDYVKQPNAKLHLYGKTAVRDGRKMGHVTLLTQG